MNLIYISSGTFGSLVLDAFKTKPSLVITQKDKRGGRGMKTPIPTPVKVYCQENNILCIECTDRNELLLHLSHNPLSDNPSETLYVVCDIGLWISKEVREWAKGNILNIHPSLLPLYRGSSPIQSALLNGDTETGVTIIQIDNEIDHGPILLQEKINIDKSDNTVSLMSKLAAISARCIETVLTFNSAGIQKKLTPQDHARATIAPKLVKEDCELKIDLLTPYLLPLFKKYNLTHLLPTSPTPVPFASEEEKVTFTEKMYNQIRALSPWPLVWTTLPNGKVLKILSSTLKNNSLTINEVSVEGKKYSAV